MHTSHLQQYISIYPTANGAAGIRYVRPAPLVNKGYREPIRIDAEPIKFRSMKAAKEFKQGYDKPIH